MNPESVVGRSFEKVLTGVMKVKGDTEGEDLSPVPPLIFHEPVSGPGSLRGQFPTGE